MDVVDVASPTSMVIIETSKVKWSMTKRLVIVMLRNDIEPEVDPSLSCQMSLDEPMQKAFADDQTAHCAQLAYSYTLFS